MITASIGLNGSSENYSEVTNYFSTPKNKSKMKNKTVILILSVLAVAIYTTAVINFCLGNVLGGGLRAMLA